MATNVIMPALGVAQQTGTLLKWLKAEGQAVAKGEPLMEIETDKATVEIEAAASGTLARVTAKAGDEVPVGQTIALILATGETEAAVQSPHAKPLPKGEGVDVGEGRGVGRSTTAMMPTPGASTIQIPGRILASPKAKRIAREQGIELKSLRG